MLVLFFYIKFLQPGERQYLIPYISNFNDNLKCFSFTASIFKFLQSF